MVDSKKVDKDSVPVRSESAGSLSDDEIDKKRAELLQTKAELYLKQGFAGGIEQHLKGAFDAAINTQLDAIEQFERLDHKLADAARMNLVGMLRKIADVYEKNPGAYPSKWEDDVRLKGVSMRELRARIFADMGKWKESADARSEQVEALKKMRSQRPDAIAFALNEKAKALFQASRYRERIAALLESTQVLEAFLIDENTVGRRANEDGVGRATTRECNMDALIDRYDDLFRAHHAQKEWDKAESALKNEIKQLQVIATHVESGGDAWGDIQANTIAAGKSMMLGRFLKELKVYDRAEAAFSSAAQLFSKTVDRIGDTDLKHLYCSADKRRLGIELDIAKLNLKTAKDNADEMKRQMARQREKAAR